MVEKLKPQAWMRSCRGPSMVRDEKEPALRPQVLHHEWLSEEAIPGKQTRRDAEEGGNQDDYGVLEAKS